MTRRPSAAPWLGAAALVALLTACGGTALPVTGDAGGAGAGTPTTGSDEAFGMLEPVWVVDDFAGSIQAVEVADGVMFVAGSRPGGDVIFRADLETAQIDWAVEQLDFSVDLIAADGEGGVVAVFGNELRAFDADGEQRWATVPLRARDGGASAGIDAIAVDDDGVLVGGDVYGSAAEISLADGQRRWFLQQDTTVTDDATFLGAGGDVAFLDADTALLAGGGSRDYTVVSVDRDSGRVGWTRQTEAAPRLVVGDRALFFRDSDTALVAVDPATGEDRWRVEDDGWDGDPLIEPVRLVGDVVVGRNIAGMTAWDAGNGEQTWTLDDREVIPLQTSPVEHDGRLVGLISASVLSVITQDGEPTSGQFWEGMSGTVEILEVEGDRALVAGRGSTDQQPSLLWLLDLTDLE